MVEEFGAKRGGGIAPDQSNLSEATLNLSEIEPYSLRWESGNFFR